MDPRQWLDKPLTLQLAKLAIVVLVIAVLVRVVRAAAARQIEDTDTRYRVRKATSLAGYVAAILAALVILSSELGNLGIILGAFGVGVGFALREVVVSVAGWLAISFGGIYKPGDRVEVAGIMGDVIDVGVLRTTLMECGGWVKGDLYNGRIVRVANSNVLKEPVYTYSGDFPFLWDEITVPIKYGTDHEKARAILDRVATEVVGDYASRARASWSHLVRRYRIEDARVDHFVTLVANDNWIELTLRYVVDYRARRITRDALFTKILAAVEASRGEVALASATFQLVEAPPISVHLELPAGVAPPSRRTPE